MFCSGVDVLHCVTFLHGLGCWNSRLCMFCVLTFFSAIGFLSGFCLVDWDLFVVNLLWD